MYCAYCGVKILCVLAYSSSTLRSSIIKPFLVLGQIRRQRLFYKCSLSAAKIFPKAFRFGFVEGFFKCASLHIYFLRFFSLYSLSWFPANSRGSNKQTRAVRPQSLPAAALSGQSDETSCPQLWCNTLLWLWAVSWRCLMTVTCSWEMIWGPSDAQVKPVFADVGESLCLLLPPLRGSKEFSSLAWLPC